MTGGRGWELQRLRQITEPDENGAHLALPIYLRLYLHTLPIDNYAAKSYTQL